MCLAIQGVTSWGYTDGTAKLQGASFFGATKELPGTYGSRGAGNIGKLMYDGELLFGLCGTNHYCMQLLLIAIF